MGVINLSILVDKVRKKLGYASASTAGVVKVGSGLSISSSGVLSATAQGLSVTALWTEGAEPTAAGDTSTELTLSQDIDKFKLIVIGITGADGKNLTNIVMDTSQIVIGSGDDAQIAATAFQATGSSVVFAGKFTAKKKFNVTASASNIYFKKVSGIK